MKLIRIIQDEWERARFMRENEKLGKALDALKQGDDSKLRRIIEKHRKRKAREKRKRWLGF